MAAYLQLVLPEQKTRYWTHPSSKGQVGTHKLNSFSKIEERISGNVFIIMNNYTRVTLTLFTLFIYCTLGCVHVYCIAMVSHVDFC